MTERRLQRKASDAVKWGRIGQIIKQRYEQGIRTTGGMRVLRSDLVKRNRVYRWNGKEVAAIHPNT